MKNISLIKYIRQSVEDEYAMNVLYHCLKKKFLDIGFVSRDMDQVVLDGRFHGEPICLSFRTRYKTPCHSLALLLSLRILMCNKKCINLCEDDNLIFLSKPLESFQWIAFTTFIMDNRNDDEIKMLYSMMKSSYFEEGLSLDEIREFRNSIAIPQFKNEDLYYSYLSDQTKGVGDEVIGNNTFVDVDIERFVINKNIKYVGNTAFAFCTKLHTLVFEGKCKLGKFSIIECPTLLQIVVPEEHVDYYKKSLPFYKEIICTEEVIMTESTMDKKRPRVGEMKDSIGLLSTPLGVDDTKKVSLASPSTVSDIKYDEVGKIPAAMQEGIPVVHKESAPIDSKILERVFDKKVTSYKFLWMLAILTLTKERGILAISFKDLTIRMASFAWPLLFDDDIDFGSLDFMKKYLTDVMRKTPLVPSATQKVVESYMRQYYDIQGISTILAPLMKNVPYRFLSPWIKFTTIEEVVAKSNAKDYNGLYAIQKDGILLDEDWWEYIETNYEKIYTFTLNSFIDYLNQYNNPMKLIKLKMR